MGNASNKLNWGQIAVTAIITILLSAVGFSFAADMKYVPRKEIEGEFSHVNGGINDIKKSIIRLHDRLDEICK